MNAKQLKNSILQMAIQGKLVPQDPNDEPASILLEKIRAEKEKLIKIGKIKKEKNPSIIFRGTDNLPYEKIGNNEPICIADEVPFEIPDSWEWVHLSNIMNVVSARRVHQSDWKTTGVPFYRAREVGKLCEQGYVNNELYISEELYNEFSKSGVPHANDIMVTAVGTLGKTYVVKENDKFYYKDASVICFENFGKINPFYIQLVMASPYMTMQIKEHSSGTTVGTITISTASNYYVPIPPLAEQKRIVDIINEILPLVEQYGYVYSEVDSLNTTFPEQLKKSILQEAVQGKLVPQDPNDEPASILLERIKSEKEKLIKEGKIK
ncbi:MAG: restriction endonuclease subunit S, partial [Peptoniphilaceae bacterium]|nr:restriction endonuclease subunit S [Peptoniphilaceae bacterium]MDD7383856.1 restriction endonuclease subunit S [Peptoniphilaceae bacterium]MDY3737997.1 restriction endonuclease subunit S [Peptoniphilaceae bacterium]